MKVFELISMLSISRQSWFKNAALFLALLVFIVERETHAHTHTNTQRDIHKTIILFLLDRATDKQLNVMTPRPNQKL